MCPACLRSTMTAGPDVVRDRVQITSTGFDAHDPETGCPNRRLDRFASRHHHPRNSIVLLRRRLDLDVLGAVVVVTDPLQRANDRIPRRLWVRGLGNTEDQASLNR